MGGGRDDHVFSSQERLKGNRVLLLGTSMDFPFVDVVGAVVGRYLPKSLILGAPFAQMRQVFEVACDQRLLLCAGPALELPLPCQSLIFRAKFLRIDQTNGVVLERVRGASTVVVGLHAGVEILC